MIELVKYFDDLTNSEKNVFNYIYDHQNEVIGMKINDLAKKALTSKTVVINMTQKLGFSGYVDFKYYLKSGYLSKKKKNKYEEMENELEDNIQKTFTLNRTVVSPEKAKLVLDDLMSVSKEFWKLKK